MAKAATLYVGWLNAAGTGGVGVGCHDTSGDGESDDVVVFVSNEHLQY